MSFHITIQTPDSAPSIAGMGASGPAPAHGSQGGTTGSQQGAPTTATMSVDSTPKKEEKKPGCGGGGLMNIGLIAVFFVVFYFFLIRPQSKRQKEHQSMLNALMKGDKIFTSGGILGTIVSLTDKHAVVEVADKTRIRVLRSHISGKQPLGNAASKPQGAKSKNDRKQSKKNKKDNA